MRTAPPRHREVGEEREARLLAHSVKKSFLHPRARVQVTGRIAPLQVAQLAGWFRLGSDRPFLLDLQSKQRPFPAHSACSPMTEQSDFVQ